MDFDTTRNLFIEGDNLEALKLLQETYLGKVKMIYIDPRTTRGMISFTMTISAEDTRIPILTAPIKLMNKAISLVANTEANGRFHSDWLVHDVSAASSRTESSIDDGVIFISIDDGEAANLAYNYATKFSENKIL